MLSKKIKFEVPKEYKCRSCGRMAKLEFAKITVDYVLVLEYICDCKKTIIRTKQADFI